MTRQSTADFADGMTKLRHVFIRDLELLAHIGIHGHEQTKHQPVRINVDLAVEDAQELEDRLDRVVDYESITLRIRAIVARGHINLAETLAETIASACLESAGVEIERHTKA
jgi:dihydroneopterin aldolase